MAELRERLLNAEEGNIKQDMATLSQVSVPTPSQVPPLRPVVCRGGAGWDAGSGLHG